MHKNFRTIKLRDIQGNETSLDTVVDPESKTALIISFSRTQNTKHLCKVWHTKLERLAGERMKICKVVAFKIPFDELFKSSYDAAVKSFNGEMSDQNVYSTYGTCAKKLYSTTNVKTEDTVVVCVYDSAKNLLFLHNDVYSENAVKKLERVV